jgi:hypothetical protein
MASSIPVADHYISTLASNYPLRYYPWLQNKDFVNVRKNCKGCPIKDRTVLLFLLYCSLDFKAHLYILLVRIGYPEEKKIPVP